jgi:hypothetical protein
MSWSFPGISYPVECVYTQTLGFQPDVAKLLCLPQVGTLPSTGTLTLTWDATTITLPNCTIDTAQMRVSEDGIMVTLLAKDRRDRWARVAPISGEYNAVRGGTAIAAQQKTLRQLGTILMTALGEPGAVVTALPTTIYPPVSWDCSSVVEAAEQLFTEYGFSVALGFGVEAVTVVQLGTGATLPTTGQFATSDSIDPKSVPQYVLNCFEPSLMQVRLKLEPVGQETDGTWEHINSLTYKPAAGWENVVPISLSDLKPATATTLQYQQAVGYVRRAYRISGFAGGTLTIPIVGGAISSVADILPVMTRLLTTEDVHPDEGYQPWKVYGKYLIEHKQKGQPDNPIIEITDNDDEVLGRQMRLYPDDGLVIFEEPMYYIASNEYRPADLWLETTIRLRDATTFAWRHYEYPVEIDPTGYGYHVIKHQDYQAETVVIYDSTHSVTGSTNNQTALNAIGDAWAVAVAGTYNTTIGQHKVYQGPKLDLRCDGAIAQVQHIMTCGEYGNSVNRTTASRMIEFDRGVHTRAARQAHLRAQASAAKIAYQNRKQKKKESALE